MFIDSSIGLKCFLLKCPEEKKQQFKKAEASLLISVGRDYHEGERMWAMINFINKSFNKCNIMVNDSLQRHTLVLYEKGEINAEQAYLKSIREGKEWVKRNSCFLDSLEISYDVYHWNNWLQKKSYIKYRAKIDQLYKEDPEFKKNMDVTIWEFIKRNKDNVDIVGFDKSYNLCLEYLLEESSIIMGVWQSYGYDFILYPGKMIDILKYTHKVLVDKNILYWLHIKFRRNNKELYKKLVKEEAWEEKTNMLKQGCGV